MSVVFGGEIFKWNESNELIKNGWRLDFLNAIHNSSPIFGLME